MKIKSLSLMGRLSRIRDEQAAETVKDYRAVVEQMRQQTRMLARYRRSMSLSEAGDRMTRGQDVRARGAFMAVADAAAQELRNEQVYSEAQLQQAMEQWAETRHRRRLLEDKHRQAQRSADRLRDKQAEKDKPQTRARARVLSD